MPATTPSPSVRGRVWRLPQNDPAAAGLARDLRLRPLLGDLLCQRGLRTPEDAQLFIEPKLNSLTDPFILTDLELAAARLWDAIDAGKRIVIFGDYDVDGITSSALLWRVLRKLGGNAETFLPHRMEEGYGLSQEGVERCVAEHKPEVLVAVDCGTTAVEQIAWLNERGVEVLVVDHHELPAELPTCRALVNPHRDGHLLYLASVGLVFKLCHGLLKLRPAARDQVDLRDIIDLVAVGTVADIVPLIGDNRILVKRGLTQLAQTSNHGLKALCQVARIGGEPKAGDVGFRIGPRLNASGRLGDAMRSLDLLKIDGMNLAMDLARELDATNRERQGLEQKTHREALAQVQASFDPERDYVVVASDEGWHVGVVGIVASRLQRHFHRPAVVMGLDAETGLGKASCRSIDGYSIIEGLRQCEDLLEVYGGHEMAAGLTMRTDRVADFREALNAHARASLRREQLVPHLDLAGTVRLDQFDEELYHQLSLLAPYGRSNAEPVFVFPNLRFSRPSRGFGNNHVKMQVKTAMGDCEAVAFGMGDVAPPVTGGHMAGVIDWSDYTGSPQIRALDWCGPQDFSPGV